MTEHRHVTLVDGCHRCELNQDENLSESDWVNIRSWGRRLRWPHSPAESILKSIVRYVERNELLP